MYRIRQEDTIRSDFPFRLPLTQVSDGVVSRQRSEKTWAELCVSRNGLQEVACVVSVSWRDFCMGFCKSLGGTQATWRLSVNEAFRDGRRGSICAVLCREASSTMPVSRIFSRASDGDFLDSPPQRGRDAVCNDDRHVDAARHWIYAGCHVQWSPQAAHGSQHGSSVHW